MPLPDLVPLPPDAEVGELIVWMAPTGLAPVEPEIFAPHDPANRRGKRKVHHALAWSWGRQ
jgi:hypothetical protein